jgi:hypothetical protein
MNYCKERKFGIILISFIIGLSFSPIIYLSIQYFDKWISKILMVFILIIITLLIYYYIKKNYEFYIIEKKSFMTEPIEGEVSMEYRLITQSNEVHSCEYLYNIILEGTTAKLKCYGIAGVRLYATDLINNDQYISDNQNKFLYDNNSERDANFIQNYAGDMLCKFCYKRMRFGLTKYCTNCGKKLYE